MKLMIIALSVASFVPSAFAQTTHTYDSQANNLVKTAFKCQAEMAASLPKGFTVLSAVKELSENFTQETITLQTGRWVNAKRDAKFQVVIKSHVECPNDVPGSDCDVVTDCSQTAL